MKSQLTVARLRSLAVIFSAAACCVGSAIAQDVVAGNLNREVKPDQDFFEYANGGWLKKNPIPASEPAWGIGNVVREQLYVSLRKINEEAAKDPKAEGDRRQIGDYWTAAMDEGLAERVGLAPLKAELDKIDAIKSVADVVDVTFGLLPLGVDAFFGAGIAQDEKNSDVMSVHLSQGGLGLPEKDFYFNTEDGIAKIRDAYVVHVGRMLKLLGRDEAGAKAAAASVMAFETALAKASRSLEDLRDPQKNYNPMAPADVTAKHTASIAWTPRLAAWKLDPAVVVVGQPEFFTALEALIHSTPIPVLQDYLRFHLVSAFAAALSKGFVDEDFDFYKRTLAGQKEPRPRWKRVLDAQDHAMGMVLGKVFVTEYFPAAAKKRYSDLVEAIRTAYGERIDRLDWMTPETKAKARQKLSTVMPKVGYPDKWKDYSALVVGRSSYCENEMNAARWRFAEAISKFGKPVDRTEWQMTPQTYNAYYNPSNNEIVLPAAAFTIPGFADADVDDAVVYGYAGGSTIGHEITHGFDDEGRQYDAKGNLENWWTEKDAAEFEHRTQVLVKQFDAFEPIPGLHIKGKASLGENLADLGGLLLGLDAFKKTAQFKEGKPIAGLTPIQRYFLGYALGWMFHEQEARLRRNLLSDVHAPAKWRVLGPLANIPEFHEAFGAKAGCPMWRAESDRVRVW